MPPLPEVTPHTAIAIDKARATRSRTSDWGMIPVSAITTECDRQIWYRLHWAVTPEPISGARQAMIDIGSSREVALIDDMQRAGLAVEDCDPDTGKQFEIRLASGWLKGRLDGVTTNVPEAPKARHAVEIKSMCGTDVRAVAKHGVAKHKPSHYAQLQLACAAADAPRGLYVVECRETGDVHTERVEIDPVMVAALEAKALRIGESAYPPPRNKGHWCSWCPARELCLIGAMARRNCRTCLHSTLLPSGLTCAKDGEAKNWNAQQAGCSAHRFIPDLVDGEQVDVRGEAIVYRRSDGTEWVDGGAS